MCKQRYWISKGNFHWRKVPSGQQCYWHRIYKVSVGFRWWQTKQLLFVHLQLTCLWFYCTTLAQISQFYFISLKKHMQNMTEDSCITCAPASKWIPRRVRGSAVVSMCFCGSQCQCEETERGYSCGFHTGMASLSVSHLLLAVSPMERGR